MKKKNFSRVGSEVQYGPRTAGKNLQGWHHNTALCVNLKTILRSDRTMKEGKEYPGMLRRDVECEEFRYDEHYSFVETLPPTVGRRNPRVFEGKYINVSRRPDGSLHPNFKEIRMDGDSTIDGYAIGVCNEIRQALIGLIEKST